MDKSEAWIPGSGSGSTQKCHGSATLYYGVDPDLDSDPDAYILSLTLKIPKKLILLVRYFNIFGPRKILKQYK